MTDHITLRQILDKRFSEGDLRDLCFDMVIDYDNLPGQSKKDKARELILVCQRKGRYNELEANVLSLRPNELLTKETDQSQVKLSDDNTYAKSQAEAVEDSKAETKKIEDQLVQFQSPIQPKKPKYELDSYRYNSNRPSFPPLLIYREPKTSYKRVWLTLIGLFFIGFIVFYNAKKMDVFQLSLTPTSVTLKEDPSMSRADRKDPLLQPSGGEDPFIDNSDKSTDFDCVIEKTYSDSISDKNANSSITVHVLDANNNVISGATIYVNNEPITKKYYYTDENGNFLIKGLEGGYWSVVLQQTPSGVLKRGQVIGLVYVNGSPDQQAVVNFIEQKLPENTETPTTTTSP